LSTISAINSFSASITPGEQVILEDKTFTGFTVITVEEVAETLVKEDEESLAIEEESSSKPVHRPRWK